MKNSTLNQYSIVNRFANIKIKDQLFNLILKYISKKKKFYSVFPWTNSGTKSNLYLY